MISQKHISEPKNNKVYNSKNEERLTTATTKASTT